MGPRPIISYIPGISMTHYIGSRGPVFKFPLPRSLFRKIDMHFRLSITSQKPILKKLFISIRAIAYVPLKRSRVILNEYIFCIAWFANHYINVRDFVVLYHVIFRIYGLSGSRVSSGLERRPPWYSRIDGVWLGIQTLTVNCTRCPSGYPSQHAYLCT